MAGGAGHLDNSNYFGGGNAPAIASERFEPIWIGKLFAFGKGEREVASIVKADDFWSFEDVFAILVRNLNVERV